MIFGCAEDRAKWALEAAERHANEDEDEDDEEGDEGEEENLDWIVDDGIVEVEDVEGEDVKDEVGNGEGQVEGEDAQMEESGPVVEDELRAVIGRIRWGAVCRR